MGTPAFLPLSATFPNLQNNHFPSLTQYLQEIISRIDTKTLHKDGVLSILSFFRQHLEKESLMSKYKILILYCNWALHTDLDRGIVQNILDEISDVIVDSSKGHPSDRIAEILSIAGLRKDIRNVLSEEGIKARIFETHDNWRVFTGFLFSFILNKPLKSRRKSNTQIYVQELSLFNPDPTSIDAKIKKQFEVGRDTVFWKIRVMPDDKEFSHPLMFTERREDFA